MGIVACEACYKYGDEWLNELLDYLENNLKHPDIEIIFFVAEEEFCKGSSVFDFPYLIFIINIYDLPN